MNAIIAGVLAAGLVVAFSGTADAAKKHRRAYDSYAQRYPDATPRQLKNLRAYERGEYYEVYSGAHPVGSRSWWELKERESGGRGFRF